LASILSQACSCAVDQSVARQPSTSTQRSTRLIQPVFQHYYFQPFQKVRWEEPNREEPCGEPYQAKTGLGLNDFDMSFVKSQQISRDWWLRLRAEFFNIWNHPNFANPTTTFGSGFRLTSTPDSFNPYFGNGSPRNVQLVVELEF
jgi:hypothetical protein